MNERDLQTPRSVQEERRCSKHKSRSSPVACGYHGGTDLHAAARRGAHGGAGCPLQPMGYHSRAGGSGLKEAATYGEPQQEQTPGWSCNL